MDQVRTLYLARERSFERGERFGREQQRKEFQRLLIAKGYLAGEADGVIGSKSRAAVRSYQNKSGLIVDGYPSVVVLKRLQRGA